MVAIVEVEKKFIMKELLDKIPETEPCMSWVKMRFSPNNNYIALYKSGKIFISGTKSYDELNNLANELLKYLKQHGISNSIKAIKVNNYVLIDQVEYKINLDKLIMKLFEYNASYEPEQFPALKFKDSNGITYLLFNSGKITITGVKSLDNLENYVEEFKELIYEKINE